MRDDNVWSETLGVLSSPIIDGGWVYIKNRAVTTTERIPEQL